MVGEEEGRADGRKVILKRMAPRFTVHVISKYANKKSTQPLLPSPIPSANDNDCVRRADSSGREGGGGQGTRAGRNGETTVSMELWPARESVKYPERSALSGIGTSRACSYWVMRESSRYIAERGHSSLILSPVTKSNGTDGALAGTNKRIRYKRQ